MIMGRNVCMSIGSVSNSISRNMTQRIVNIMPSMTVSNERALKSLKWIGEKVSSPENRLILGGSALMSQPFIDLHNRKVDEDTRKISAARTVAKIIAGTATGVLIRSGCIHAINAFTKLPSEITPNMKFKNLRTLFTPSLGLCANLNKYKKAMGTILATVVMMFTNFLIDAPLTKFLTNKFIDRIHQDSSNNQPQSEEKNKEVKHG